MLKAKIIFLGICPRVTLTNVHEELCLSTVEATATWTQKSTTGRRMLKYIVCHLFTHTKLRTAVNISQ